MKQCKDLVCFLFGGHVPCPGCRVCVQLTGRPPCNPSEELVKRIAGDRGSAPLHWLEERIGEELYRTALCKGAWAADIGVWGPELFHGETSLILEAMRPEFGCLTEQRG
ncbi:MAG: hypothetical protein HYX92_06565 [Chloroflexi bacterium]|nr:hypothetical protein [Chloroflexota bacterium]